MNKKTNYGINKLYSKDPIEADRLLWGRRTSALTRRGFLNNSALMAMIATLGSAIPYGRFLPAGLIPAAFAADNAPDRIEGKEGLIILNDRPVNAETPPHLLDDDVTPNRYMFIRNNGLLPENTDPQSWQLEVGGGILPTTYYIYNS